MDKKLSLIVVTKNSEKYIEKLLRSIVNELDEETMELIIIDDLSNDQTVPLIVGSVGYNFMDENSYKFYINTSEKGIKLSKKMGKEMARGKPFFISTKKVIRKNILKKLERSDCLRFKLPI